MNALSFKPVDTDWIVTKGDVAKTACPDKEYDTALPQSWVDAVESFLKAVEPKLVEQPIRLHFVWVYDEYNRLTGRPYPIDDIGVDIMSLLSCAPPRL